MQKLIVKPTKETIIKRLQTLTTIEELLLIPGYTLFLNDEHVEDIDAYDDIVEIDDNFTEDPDEANSVEVRCVANANARCRVRLIQQPATCANALAFCFEIGEGNYSKTTLTYLFKAVEFTAHQSGYTNISFSNLATSPSVEIAKTLGWQETARYINKRTHNELVDMRLVL